MAELKTSKEWQVLCKILIYDPDGWRNLPDLDIDRWNKEKITREEFEKRMCSSTIIWREDLPKVKKMKNWSDNIWLDKEDQYE